MDRPSQAGQRAAARDKPSRDAVRDEARKAQVIAFAMAVAETRVPDRVVADLWERMVEAWIAHESAAFDRRATRA